MNQQPESTLGRYHLNLCYREYLNPSPGRQGNRLVRKVGKKFPVGYVVLRLSIQAVFVLTVLSPGIYPWPTAPGYKYSLEIARSSDSDLTHRTV